ncbi:MAG TPA: hypothetical protein VF635_14780 [Propionibacteriaceae bacterium]
MTPAQEPEPTRGAGAGSDQPPGVPNWVKISAIVVAILVVAVIVAMLLGGNHGPGRHMSAPTSELKASQILEGARSGV